MKLVKTLRALAAQAEEARRPDQAEEFGKW